MPLVRGVVCTLAAGMLAGCMGRSASAPPGGTGPQEMVASDPVFVSLTNGQAALSPTNTTIEFVGTHVGDRPDPRLGKFGQFHGSLVADPATRLLSSVAVEIDTSSLATEIERLTGHLKSPDFFDVNQYPQASFTSTSIERVPDGDEYLVRGNLTLHGVTREISFKALPTFDDAGIQLSSIFTIDRTDFGMDWGQERVNKEVEVRVVVGQPTR